MPDLFIILTAEDRKKINELKSPTIKIEIPPKVNPLRLVEAEIEITENPIIKNKEKERG